MVSIIHLKCLANWNLLSRQPEVFKIIKISFCLDLFQNNVNKYLVIVSNMTKSVGMNAAAEWTIFII